MKKRRRVPFQTHHAAMAVESVSTVAAIAHFLATGDASNATIRPIQDRIMTRLRATIGNRDADLPVNAADTCLFMAGVLREVLAQLESVNEPPAAATDGPAPRGA